MRRLIAPILLAGALSCLTVGPVPASAAGAEAVSAARLERRSYESPADGERQFFAYLPAGYDSSPGREWPLLLVLHGNGERGDGREDLDWVTVHGPLYEAWVQKRDLPFVIVAPQLPLFGFEETVSYIRDRDVASIPRRLAEGVPPRRSEFETPFPMTGATPDAELPHGPEGPPRGWSEREEDLLLVLDRMIRDFRVDPDRVYLTGLSYGGFGTWYLASRHPDRFAAIAPVVGWGHPELMPPLAERRMPIWAFAGGRDRAVEVKHFYPGLNELERLGHAEFRFTIHEDAGHDAWKRIYAGRDLYDWLLSHSLSADGGAEKLARGSRDSWWGEPYPRPFDAGSLAPGLDFLRVEGNRFVDAAGRTVVLRGVSVGDPDKLDRSGRWSRELFEEVADWGANVVRLPVHPVAWRDRGRDGYFQLLDRAVVWASELGLYLMIDWHSIGNLQSGLFQHPMYDTSRSETLEFWRQVALRYQGIPAVAFYEIFNEPTVYNGTLGRASWEEWKRFNEEAIEIIFAHDRQVIPLVAGFNWAYDLTPVAEAPVEVQGIGYVSHPYPQKVAPPWEEKWERDFGFVADRYPVVVTEFGYMAPDEPGAHVPVMDDGEYGPAILDYLASRGISWVAWCFDPDWGPHLISDWDYTPTEAGALFRRALRDQPNDSSADELE